MKRLLDLMTVYKLNQDNDRKSNYCLDKILKPSSGGMKNIFESLSGCPVTDQIEKFVALICDRRALPYPSNLHSFLTVIHETLKDIKTHGYGHDQWDDHLSAKEVVDLLFEMKGLCNYLAKNGPCVVRPSAVSLIGLILHHSTAALATSGS